MQKGGEFLDAILARWSPPSFFYHFQPGGHIAAIEVHKGNKFFAKLDIQKFFPSISKNKVLRALKSIGFSYFNADRIAEWSVIVSKDDRRKKILPYGFVQSPLLAALYLGRSSIGKYMEDGLPKNVKISVYVDDIILSSNDKNALEVTYQQILSVIRNAGFSINLAKSHASQDTSTAFNIDFDASEMEISQERFADFQGCMSLPVSKRVEAIVAYVHRVCPAQGETLIQILEQMEQSNTSV